MAAIPERVWELLTDDEANDLREMIDGWRHEPRIICPNCQTAIGVRLKIQAVARFADPETVPRPPVESTPPLVEVNPTIVAAEQALLESAERTGLMKAFVRAVHEAKGSAGVPTNMGQFFLDFLRAAVAKKVPGFVIRRFNGLFNGNLTFWSSQGVMAVSVDGVIRMFVPLSYIVGAPITSIGTNKMGGRLQANEQDLEVWVRGKFGYVPMHSENYLDAMKRSNIGKFCEFVQ